MSDPRPPAAESGTPAPGEVGREALRREALLREVESLCPDCGGTGYTVASEHGCDGSGEEACMANCPVPVQAQCDGTAHAMAAALASLLSASPASETHRCTVRCSPFTGAHDFEPASETPGWPHGAGADTPTDLSGPTTDAATYLASETPGPGEGDLRGEPLGAALANLYKAQRDAALEQRALAEQKVARVEALCDEAEEDYNDRHAPVVTSAIRAALADPEADR